MSEQNKENLQDTPQVPEEPTGVPETEKSNTVKIETTQDLAAADKTTNKPQTAKQEKTDKIDTTQDLAAADKTNKDSTKTKKESKTAKKAKAEKSGSAEIDTTQDLAADKKSAAPEKSAASEDMVKDVPYDENSANAKSALPSEDVDDYVYAHYRRRRHADRHRTHHSSNKGDYTKTEENENTQVVYSTSATHYRDKAPVGSRRHKWNKLPWWKKLLIYLGGFFGILLSLLLIAAIVFFIMRGVGMKKLTNYSDMNMTAPVIENAGVHINENGKSVFYKGKEYVFNDDITSIMCIGVDRTELGVDDILGTGGQGDALFLIALDTETGETSVISVPRDIVTDIGIYSSTGEYLKTEKRQLCLAYAYGDGRKTSCLNTVTAVSRLFYQLPINSYFSIDLSAVAKLNDAVGGVTVTMIDNSFFDTDLVQHYEGEVLTLHGDNARKYVQQRDVNRLESSSERMQRQMNYLNAFTAKTLKKTKKDLKTPLKLMEIINNNSETNLDASKIAAFAGTLVENGISEVDFKSVPGHLESDGTYAQFIVNEEKFYEMVLDVYYTPVE